LQENGISLNAYTSVPVYDTTPYVGDRFGDEHPYARSVAQYAGNIDLHSVRAESTTPLQVIRRWLPVFNEPMHAAGNFYWMLKLLETAFVQGHRALLTGQCGNAGISWHGDPASQPLFTRLRFLSQHGSSRTAILMGIKNSLRHRTPAGMLEFYRRLRHQVDGGRPYSDTAIHPDFARRLNLYHRHREYSDSRPPRTPRASHFNILRPGRLIGALWAEMGAFSGLEVRDPTADPRVLAFAIAVPDHIFIEPRTAQDRWLIREAMKGRLPDEVRLNRKRGRQAGDLVPRLRACAAEVETALAEIETGPARQYLDAPYMRQVWEMVQTEDTPEVFRKSITILTRGIMAGLWVNGFEEGKQ